MIRVLMVSKAMVTAAYRTKLDDLNRIDPEVEVGLVLPPGWGSLPLEGGGEASSFPMWVSPIWFPGRNHFHRYPGLARIVHEYRPDILHLDEEHYSWVTYEGLRIARRAGIRTLFFTWQNIEKTYPWPFSAMERTVLRHADFALAGNAEAEAILRHKGYRGPTRVIPQFGCDPERFQPRKEAALRERFGWAGQFAIGYVGRLIPDKGLDDLMEAALPLLSRRSELALVFVGQGPWAEVGRRRAEAAGLASRVFWVPWVASSEMPRVMNALDLLVLPSRTTPSWKEQFGRVLTEAMASGVPVVGSSSGEIPQVIGDAGWIFPEGQSGRLAEVLESAVADPEARAEMARRGRERVLSRFTQDAVAKDTLEVYHAMMERSPGA